MAFSSCDLNESVCEALEKAGLARFDLADDSETDPESAGNIRAANAVQKAIDDRAALLATLKAIQRCPQAAPWLVRVYIDVAADIAKAEASTTRAEA